jgi:hypothetical protein
MFPLLPTRQTRKFPATKIRCLPEVITYRRSFLRLTKLEPLRYNSRVYFEGTPMRLPFMICCKGALVFLCLFCSLAKAQVVGDARIVREPSFGCKDINDYRKLSELFKQSFEAARGFMEAKKNDCMYFDPGSLVKIDSHSPSRPGQTEDCVRPEKEYFVCFWVGLDTLGVPEDMELLEPPEMRKGQWLGRTLRQGK